MSKLSRYALLSMVGVISELEGERPTQVRSYKVEQKRVEEQLSKQQIQKLKGKKARKSRGKNRRTT